MATSTKQCVKCFTYYDTESQFCSDRQCGGTLVEVKPWAPETEIRGSNKTFRILETIAMGETTIVYRAKEITKNKLCALKVLKPNRASDPNYVARFEREAEFSRRIRDPNVVIVYGSHTSDDGSRFIEMEYVDGKTLRQIMPRGVKLSVDAVCDITRQIARALAAVHGLKIVHRDIKPENILVVAAPKGRVVRLLDFGVAKVDESHYSLPHLTREWIVVGTPAYMSPEQLRLDELTGRPEDEVDGRSDLYSLGVMTYEMLAGFNPFRANSLMETATKHFRDTPVHIRELRPDLDPQIADLVMSCLEKERDKRPPNCAAFAETIERLWAPPAEQDIRNDEEVPFNVTYQFNEESLPAGTDALAKALIHISALGETPVFKPLCHISLLLDVSASMNQPQKYPLVVHAVRELLGTLSTTDLVTLILFSAGVDPILTASPVREVDVEKVVRRVNESGVKFGNRTMVSAALERADREIGALANEQAPDVVHRIYILTDGQFHDLDQAVSNTEGLRRKKVEAHAFGFGEDWNLFHLRTLISSISTTGTVKPIPNTEDVKRVFGRISEVTSLITGSDAELGIDFGPEVLGGDIFRVEPARKYFGKQCYSAESAAVVPIGVLESQRAYIFAVEGRVMPTHDTFTHFATITLRCRLRGSNRTLRRKMILPRAKGRRREVKEDPEVRQAFVILESFRTSTGDAILAGLRARHELATIEGRDPRLIEALDKAIAELVRTGSLDTLKPLDRDLVRSDEVTQAEYEGP